MSLNHTALWYVGLPVGQLKYKTIAMSSPTRSTICPWYRTQPSLSNVWKNLPLSVAQSTVLLTLFFLCAISILLFSHVFPGEASHASCVVHILPPQSHWGKVKQGSRIPVPSKCQSGSLS